MKAVDLSKSKMESPLDTTSIAVSYAVGPQSLSTTAKPLLLSHLSNSGRTAPGPPTIIVWVMPCKARFVSAGGSDAEGLTNKMGMFFLAAGPDITMASGKFSPVVITAVVGAGLFSEEEIDDILDLIAAAVP